jgi:hypothetical protein
LQCRKPDLKVLPTSVSAPRSEEWSGKNKNEKLDDVKETEMRRGVERTSMRSCTKKKRQEMRRGVERTRMGSCTKKKRQEMRRGVERTRMRSYTKKKRQKMRRGVERTRRKAR